MLVQSVRLTRHHDTWGQEEKKEKTDKYKNAYTHTAVLVELNLFVFSRRDFFNCLHRVCFSKNA